MTVRSWSAGATVKGCLAGSPTEPLPRSITALVVFIRPCRLKGSRERSGGRIADFGGCVNASCPSREVAEVCPKDVPAALGGAISRCPAGAPGHRAGRSPRPAQVNRFSRAGSSRCGQDIDSTRRIPDNKRRCIPRPRITADCSCTRPTGRSGFAVSGPPSATAGRLTTSRLTIAEGRAAEDDGRKTETGEDDDFA